MRPESQPNGRILKRLKTYIVGLERETNSIYVPCMCVGLGGSLEPIQYNTECGQGQCDPKKGPKHFLEKEGLDLKLAGV